MGLGMSLFVIVSCFCCLYLVSFAHVANSVMSRDWLVSSSISILIDLFAFEILPAVAVANLGILYLGCQIKCFFWLLVSIEWYRLIRNIAST